MSLPLANAVSSYSFWYFIKKGRNANPPVVHILGIRLEDLKIKTRLTNEKFASVKGECEI
jgi:hypothetical protein